MIVNSTFFEEQNSIQRFVLPKESKGKLVGTGNNFTWPFMVNGSQEISVFHVVSILEDDQVVYSLMHFHMYIMFTFENSWS